MSENAKHYGALWDVIGVLWGIAEALRIVPGHYRALWDVTERCGSTKGYCGASGDITEHCGMLQLVGWGLTAFSAQKSHTMPGGIKERCRSVIECCGVLQNITEVLRNHYGKY